MAVKVINTEKFRTEIFDYKSNQEFSFSKDKPVILNFFATWCGPCQVFKPALETVAEKYEGKMDVFKIDIDADPEIPALFGIRSVPTTVFFIPNGQPAMVTGNIGNDGLERAIKELLIKE